MSTPPMLELNNISKGFPGVKALKNVDFTLNQGEILGLAGENGAGKSTMIKILGGVHQPDQGTISLDGKPVTVPNTHAGITMGISIIYQELSLVPELSIAENLYLGALPHTGGKINYEVLYENSRQILSLLGLSVSPKEKVGGLSISLQQLVEIGKALARDAKILIMDEPTSSLGKEDAHRLFDTMRSLRTKGYGILFISHRLDELFEVTDRIAVLRDGTMVEARATKDWTMDDLVFAMVNRKIDQLYPKRPLPLGERIFEAESLENRLIRNVSFSLKAGEILGVAGLIGSGRTELLKTIYGAYRTRKGRMRLLGKAFAPHSPKEALAKGVVLIPENRKLEGLVLSDTVKENVVLSIFKRISSFGCIKKERIDKIAAKAIDDFEIRTPSKEQLVLRLSGGNQQKILFARGSENRPRLLLLDEPTRGIDIGSKVDIYHKIMNFAEKGMAIILVSSELTELLGLSDRILVMREGAMTADLKAAEADSNIIMQYAAGGK